MAAHQQGEADSGGMMSSVKGGVAAGMGGINSRVAGTSGEQLEKIIHVGNVVTGFTLLIFSGAMYALRNLSYLWCTDDKAYDDSTTGMFSPGCCTTVDAATMKCADSYGIQFSAFVIAIYMTLFGALLLIYELSTKLSPKLTNFLTKYFGFIYFYKRRTQFLLFIGVLCLGNVNDAGEWFKPVVGGILAILMAIMHIVVVKQHPDFDKQTQAKVEAANLGGSDAIGGEDDMYSDAGYPADVPGTAI